MSKLKVIFLSALGLIDSVILVLTIGYLIMGIKAPNSLGGREVLFTGSYILFLVYLLIFIVVTVIFLICLIKWINKAKKNSVKKTVMKE